MTRVSIRRGLVEALTGGPVRRAVDRVTDRAERAVREHVPDAKTWVSTQMIRPAHTTAHGQTIPANIGYRLDKPKGAGWDVADRPRDPSLPEHQRINCKCQSEPQPGLIAQAVSRTSAQVGRRRVTAKVIVAFPRIAESEYAEHGGGWLAAAARSVAART